MGVLLKLERERQENRSALQGGMDPEKVSFGFHRYILTAKLGLRITLLYNLAI